MPIPKKEGETRDEFISRCMSMEKKKFPDTKQRAAVCFSKWKEHMKKSNKEKEQ